MFREYSYLCDDAKYIREEVFVKEQSFVEEFDDIDSQAVHVVYYVNKRPAAVCRFFQSETIGEYTLGRIAVLKEVL